jgi:hypothetical protein
MRSGDPALIVSLGSRGNSRTISAQDGDLISGVDLLAATGRALGALAALAAALLLREEGSDPGVVDEVDGSGEDAGEDCVQEKTTSMLAQSKQGTVRMQYA